ncbi:xanthine phosphoribosyltransferase [Eubacteriales bacterium OttesenSCG-928-N13]|nr:xanthine phosphoribosyltransferase [Eubacteriales bacterium OttesenSCG-928-N13]
MELLKQRILTDGKALNSDVLLVDSFINHQIDPPLMQAIGDEFARLFKDQGITHIVTIESSGIAPALMAAIAMDVPMVIMKKSISSILSEELHQTPVYSFTKGTTYQLTLKSQFIKKGDRVLFIDDFLANGEAALGAARVIEMAGATVAGMGIVIEKAFQPGRERLIQAGYAPISLARISYMEAGVVEFEP